MLKSRYGTEPELSGTVVDTFREEQVQPALDDVAGEVAAVAAGAGPLAGEQLDEAAGQLARAEQDPDRQLLVALEAPEDVGRPQDVLGVARAGAIGAGRPVGKQVVLDIGRLLQVRLRVRVRLRRAGRGRRREELQHPQRLGALRDAVVPRVGPEPHRLAAFDAVHLAGLRVRKQQHPAEDVEDLVGAEVRPCALRVAEPVARGEREHELLDLLVRDVDPVVHEARRLVAPQLQRRVGGPDRAGRRRHHRRRVGRGHGVLSSSGGRRIESRGLQATVTCAPSSRISAWGGRVTVSSRSPRSIR